jgi:hypothetical protein
LRRSSTNKFISKLEQSPLRGGQCVSERGFRGVCFDLLLGF